jgi:hypothetical protein
VACALSYLLQSLCGGRSSLNQSFRHRANHPLKLSPPTRMSHERHGPASEKKGAKMSGKSFSYITAPVRVHSPEERSRWLTIRSIPEILMEQRLIPNFRIPIPSSNRFSDFLDLQLGHPPRTECNVVMQAHQRLDAPKKEQKEYKNRN